MKRYKFITNIVGYAAIVAAGLTAYSCTGNFKKINTDPNNLTEEEYGWDYLDLGSPITQMEMSIVPLLDVTANDFQRAQNLTGDIFSGHQTAIGDWNGSSNNSTYNLRYADWNDVGFRVAFENIMSPWRQVKVKAETDVPHVYALATILKVAGMHRIADNYGPIPYSKFGAGGTMIEYDSQKDVYYQFFDELNAAIATLTEFVTADPSAKPMVKFDLVYKGDYSKWIKYANSLKLRLAMRIRFADAALPASDPKKGFAEKYAREAIAAGVLTSNDDNATVTSYMGVQVANPLSVCWSSYEDTRMGANMDSYLNGYADERRTKYFSLCEDMTSVLTPRPTGYFGVRNGLPQHNKANFTMMSAPTATPTTPVILMTAAEVSFLMAEAKLIWNIGTQTVQALYENGISLSFQQWGLAVTQAYLDGTTGAAAFVDKSNNTTKYNASSPASAMSVKWTDRAATTELQLQKILTQKWIALYPDGQEAWSEFRRTTYPRLITISANNSGGTITASTTAAIRRVIYPATEYSRNSVNVNAAVALLNSESAGKVVAGDNGGVRVWWDRK